MLTLCLGRNGLFTTGSNIIWIYNIPFGVPTFLAREYPAMTASIASLPNFCTPGLCFWFLAWKNDDDPVWAWRILLWMNLVTLFAILSPMLTAFCTKEFEILRTSVDPKLLDFLWRISVLPIYILFNEYIGILRS